VGAQCAGERDGGALDRFKLTVQRFFPLPAGSPVDAFRPLVDRYPAFELLEREETRPR
jgi:hypothetical protein